MIKKYEHYKDSGVEWLGEIPEHWEITRLANLGRFSTSGIDKLFKKNESSVKIINYTDVYKNLRYTIDSNINFMEVTTSESNRLKNLVKKGDLIFLPSSETFEDLGLCALVEENIENLSFSYHVLRFEFSKEIDHNFKKYFTNNSSILTEFSKKGTGSIRKTLGRNDFRNTIVILPPLPEQTAIANFLDDKTTKIDQAIAIKQQQIALLKERKQILIHKAVTGQLIMENGKWIMTPKEKMKDSGVEWIGEIPEHWQVKKLKEVCKAFGRIGFRGYTTSDLVNEGEGAITISPSNIKDEFMTFEKCSYLSWKKYEESPEIQIFNDDVLIVKTGSTFGKVGIVKDLPQKATINPQLLVFKEININPDYFYTALKTSMIQIQIQQEVIGSTIPTISETKILNFKIALPPQKEIERVIVYLNDINEKFKTAISLKQQEIEKLKEYKSSLINSVVTGKVKIIEN